jgi:hypothetical protein
MISDRSWADALFVSFTPINDDGPLTAAILNHLLFPIDTWYPSWPGPTLTELGHIESASPAYVPEVHLGAFYQLSTTEAGIIAYLVDLSKCI